jgi:hypothetical protein
MDTMTTQFRTAAAVEHASTFERRSPSRTQEAALTMCALWLTGGLLLDNWAHTNKETLESFWTPWHAVMYGGSAACIAALGWMMYGNVKRGATLRASIPLGYEPVALGSILLGVSGVGDMLWHTAFGIERGLPIFFSPSHITLIVGMGLIVSGPWQRSIRHPDAGPELDRSWAHSWPAVLSVSMVAVGFSVITGFAAAVEGNVLRLDDLGALNDAGLGDVFINLGINSILGSIVLISLTIGSMVRRRHLPLGALTIACAMVPAALGSSSRWSNWELAIAFALGGLATEFVIAALGTRADSRLGRIGVGALLAAALSGGYIAVTAARYGLDIDPEFWSGTIMWSAVIGGGIAMNAAHIRPEVVAPMG